jgi:3D-(3,5/4)-trihydroxycyclohexane-1,2-dione acylhydrolase (decyclizing)
VADARLVLEAWIQALADYQVSPAYAGKISSGRETWDQEVSRLYDRGTTGKPAQSEVIGVLNETLRPQDVIVNAAGSAPGDLHKLWQSRDHKSYHMEYGYSCMGYEIPAALGIKMAAPDREVYALVGDGTYLMMPSEIVTSIQEGYKLNIVVVENHGYASIGSLSRSLGSQAFGTQYRERQDQTGQLTGEYLQLDFAENARGLGAVAIDTQNLTEFKQALEKAKSTDRTTVIVVHTDTSLPVPGYESWWDVAVAEVSEMDTVKEARQEYEEMKKQERNFL